ncbi:MAG: molybdenum cofactor biosynthesis protein MoaE [bacterium]|nr:molybdenum cofactor biosynthesis protein MoaE [bacterium]
MFGLTQEPLSLEPLLEKVGRDTAGALAGFVGVTRNNNLGQEVRYLEYEAYPQMALAKMAQVAEEAKARHQVFEVAIWHRLGLVEIGQASVVIAVSAAHRHEAFAACEFAIDRLKEIVPIWKKEFFDQEGARWVPNRTDRQP